MGNRRQGTQDNAFEEALKALGQWQGETGKARKHQGHAEDDLQMQCVRWFRLQYPQLARLLHHSPNGGRRDAREGARFKHMGTQAGFPDLILLVASQGYHALLLELKTRTGRQQDSQKEYQQLAEAQGYRYVVIRSLDAFMDEVNTYIK
jgi:hypothetical protein|nr:MAG TPA: Nuclease [Caudoviricetes sp.]